MTYESALSFLQSLQFRRGITYSLDHFYQVLAQLESPHLGLPRVIHVAGTNGKGSTVAYLSAGLQALGYRVGTYTSPHLHSYRERICVNDQPISETDFSRLVSQLRRFKRLSEFELLTAMAFLYFQDASLDYVILETGLGGRLDATNVVTPCLSIITSIDKDHEALLGHTIASIAKEKGGIIKPRIPVVFSYDLSPYKKRILSGIAKEKQSPILKAPAFKGDLTAFQLRGDFQRANIGLALTALEALGLSVTPDMLTRASHPGRYQIVMENHTTFVFDAAHNPAALKALLQALSYDFPGLQPVVFFGVLKRKQIAPMIRIMQQYVDTFFYCDFLPGESYSYDDVRQHIPASNCAEMPVYDGKKLGQFPLVLVTGSIQFLDTIMTQKSNR